MDATLRNRFPCDTGSGIDVKVTWKFKVLSYLTVHALKTFDLGVFSVHKDTE